MEKNFYNQPSGDNLKLNTDRDNVLDVDRDNAEWDRLVGKKQNPSRRGIAKRNMHATAQYSLNGYTVAGEASSTDRVSNENTSDAPKQNIYHRVNSGTKNAHGAMTNVRAESEQKNRETSRLKNNNLSDSNLNGKNRSDILPRDNNKHVNSIGGERNRPRQVTVAKNNAVYLPTKSNDIVRVKGGIDRPMLIIVIALICFGLVMVFSASYAYALSKTGDSFYYIKRQAGFAAVGLTAMILVINVDYQWIKKATVLFFLIMVVFLIITPIYGLAAGVATRWIDIGGFRFQPSEVMKLALVLILALYFSKYEKFAQYYDDFWLSSTYGLFIPAGIVGFVCVLIMLENHFSCMIIMFLIGMIVIFSAGARKFWFVVVGGGGAVAALIAISLSSYARERIDVWLNPQNYAADDEVYQTLQGLYAVGSGGFLGVGLGNSRQKHLFVSQPQNDFIFSIICEELGFVGAVGVIALFILLVWRGVVIALRAPDTYSQLVVIGIVGKVAIQALLNIGVVTSLLPNTGISLPFFSYGGSALMMQIGEMGIVLGISKYSRKT